MPPGMLGADLDSLAALGSQLDRTTGEIGDVSGDAQRVAQTVVDEMTVTFETAKSQIEAAMDALDSTISALAGQTDTTQWTGANGDTFRDATARFQESCAQIRMETTNASNDFYANAETLKETLLAFQAALATNLANAADSSQSMSGAVAAQSQALDATMNTGLSLA